MKLRFALLFTLVAVATHYYLSVHYYELALGMTTGEAACNVNQVFNCDSASASRFAQLFGVPLAAWGAGANLILVLLIFGWMIGWTEKIKFHATFTFALAGIIALASIIMGTISLAFLKQYCLFCMLTYLMSFLTFELLRRSLKQLGDETGEPTGFGILKLLFTKNFIKVYGGFLIAIPASALLLDQAILNQFGAKNINEMVTYSVSDWQLAPALSFDVPPSFTSGAENAKFVISEFADFRCSHCKNAAPSIAAFVKSHPDVQLRFYNFPLDGVCNEGIPANGISCLLASAAHCAEKIDKQGYSMHDKIFAKQNEFMQANISLAKDMIKKLAEEINMDPLGLLTCVESEETLSAIKAQASLGRRVNVEGTPSFFANDKKLPRAQSLPVLKKAYELSK